jgi:hypothetical protein
MRSGGNAVGGPDRSGGGQGAFDDDVTLATRDLLFDPQTSGGLLKCCPPARVSDLIGWAREELPMPCGVVGHVIEAAGTPLTKVRKRGCFPVYGAGQFAS